jgi:hypothetical protein
VAETTAEIVYGAVDSAAVEFVTTTTGEIAQAAQLGFFVLYAGHVFADIGQKSWALAFSSALGGMNESEATTFAELEDVVGIRVDPVIDSSAARVGFAASWFHDDEVRPGFFYLADQNHWRLKVHMARRERRYGYHYFTTSVALLLHHLLRENAQDPAQRDRLIEAADLTAALHRDGDLHLPAHWTRAVSLAAEDAWGSTPVRE